MISKVNQRKLIHLIISDTETRSLIIKLLSHLPIEVSNFESIDAFFAAPISETPSCLITEIYSEVIDGIHFIKTMRKHGLFIPVIVLANGEDSVNNAVKAIQAGAVDCIEKPIVERDFLERVEKVLQMST